MAFSLSQWIDYWHGEFSAMGISYYGGYPFAENIVHKWSRTVKDLEEKAQLEADAKLMGGKKKTPTQDMLDSLLGPQMLKYASDAYWETSTAVESGLIDVWDTLPLKTKGRIIAYRQIQSASEGLNRYVTELKRNAERERQKKSQASKPAPRKRRRK